MDLDNISDRVECPVKEIFSDGVYARTVMMPRGSIIIGKKHLTRHLNIILAGKATVWMDGDVSTIEAPAIIESQEGCRKVLHILEDMTWTTIHATDEKDTKVIEKQIISSEPIGEIETIIKELECHG